jgi:redox-sensitive bicupin YhaK (pirin superfamily)
MDVEYLVAGSWTRDGAGVRLYRVFGSPFVL